MEKPDNTEFDIQHKTSFKNSRKIKILQKNKRTEKQTPLLDDKQKLEIYKKKRKWKPQATGKLTYFLLLLPLTLLFSTQVGL